MLKKIIKMYFFLQHDSIQFPAPKLQQQAPPAFCIIHVEGAGAFCVMCTGRSSMQHTGDWGRIRRARIPAPLLFWNFRYRKRTFPGSGKVTGMAWSLPCWSLIRLRGKSVVYGLVQQLLYLLWLLERYMGTRVLFKSIGKVCMTRVRTGWKSGVEKCASTKIVKNWVIWGLLGQIYKSQALWNLLPNRRLARKRM